MPASDPDPHPSPTDHRMRLPAPALLVTLPLVALPLACGGSPEEPRGLVIQNEDPDDPARPHFFDFGELEHGSQREQAIRFLNTDPTPVTITEASPACACTSAKRLRLVDPGGAVLEEGDLERRGAMLTIPPGGVAELLLGVNTKSVLPNKEKLAILRLQTDSLNSPFITLEVHLATTRPFLVSPPSIQVGQVPFSHGGAQQCEVMTSRKGAEERVLGIRSTSGGIEASLDYVFINAEHVWTVTARTLPLQPKGPVRGQVVLDTSLENGERGTLEIDVWAQVVDDVGFDRPNPHFGRLRAGETRTLPLQLVARAPGLRIQVEDVVLRGSAAEHLSVQFQPQEGAYVDDEGLCELWSVDVVAGEGLPPGRFEVELIALLTDEQFPEVTTQVQGVVQ